MARSHCVRYHAYLVLERHSLPSGNAFDNEESVHDGSRVNVQFLRKVGFSGEVDTDVEYLHKQSSKDNSEKNSEFSELTLEAESVPEQH